MQQDDTRNNRNSRNPAEEQTELTGHVNERVYCSKARRLNSFAQLAKALARLPATPSQPTGMMGDRQTRTIQPPLACLPIATPLPDQSDSPPTNKDSALVRLPRSQTCSNLPRPLAEREGSVSLKIDSCTLSGSTVPTLTQESTDSIIDSDEKREIIFPVSTQRGVTGIVDSQQCRGSRRFTSAHESIIDCAPGERVLSHATHVNHCNLIKGRNVWSTTENDKTTKNALRVDQARDPKQHNVRAPTRINPLAFVHDSNWVPQAEDVGCADREVFRRNQRRISLLDCSRSDYWQWSNASSLASPLTLGLATQTKILEHCNVPFLNDVRSRDLDARKGLRSSSACAEVGTSCA